MLHTQVSINSADLFEKVYNIYWVGNMLGEIRFFSSRGFVCHIPNICINHGPSNSHVLFCILEVTPLILHGVCTFTGLNGASISHVCTYDGCYIFELLPQVLEGPVSVFHPHIATGRPLNIATGLPFGRKPKTAMEHPVPS